jgi:hypothetical protein
MVESLPARRCHTRANLFTPESNAFSTPTWCGRGVHSFGIEISGIFERLHVYGQRFPTLTAYFYGLHVTYVLADQLHLDVCCGLQTTNCKLIQIVVQLAQLSCNFNDMLDVTLLG